VLILFLCFNGVQVRANDALQNTRRNTALADAIRPFTTKKRLLSFQFYSEDYFSDEIVTSWKDTFAGLGTAQLVNVRSRGYDVGTSGAKKFGYKWMCKFFTVDLYDYLRDFDYYLRVDSDNVLSPVPYDIFEWAERKKLEYAYVIRKLEPHQKTAESLPLFVENYVSKCHVHRQIREPPLKRDFIFNFYNNFHIGKVSFFNRPDVRHFLVAANASYLYAHRWGDSTIQAYAVRIFMSPQLVQQLPNVSYHHLSHGSALVTSDPEKKTQIPQVFPSGNWTVNKLLSTKSFAITFKKPKPGPPAGSSRVQSRPVIIKNKPSKVTSKSKRQSLLHKQKFKRSANQM
jgi:hypothetical protein